MGKMYHFWIGVLLLMLCVSCASVSFQQDSADHQKEIDKLTARLTRQPRDAKTLRDLGAVYFQTGDYRQAGHFLNLAAQFGNSDAKTLFYLGLSKEFDRQENDALLIYQRYREFSGMSAYGKRMKGRFHWLGREIARQEAQKLVANMAAADRVASHAIAVFPMIYRGSDSKFSAIGRGLSEMILIDLGKIPDLKIVERIRIQALLAELAASNQAYIEPKTSPRYGQLLGAGKIVGGVYQVLDERLAVYTAAWDIRRKPVPGVSSEEDRLENLFRLEKNIVFQILDDLNIRLTPKQREELLPSPTRNFQAFLAYCMGLEEEDAGYFDKAALFYQEALRYDPHFHTATGGLARSESIVLSGGSKEAALESLRREQSASGTPEQVSLKNNRLKNMSANIGATFIAGEDSRTPAEEAVRAGIDIDPLPLPPPPP